MNCECSYTKGVDMWSLGCILGEMLLCKPLFPGSSTLNQLERILTYLPPPSKGDIDAIKSDLGHQVLSKITIKYAALLASACLPASIALCRIAHQRTRAHRHVGIG